MSEHLTPEKLRRLARYQLRGEELVEALNHLESCAECRSKMPKPTAAEIIERLMLEDDGSEDKRAENNSNMQ